MVPINVFGFYPHEDSLAAQVILSSRFSLIKINPAQP